MKKNMSAVISLLILAAAITLAVLLVIHALDRFEGGLEKSLLILVCILAIMLSAFTVPLAHELGHLIFGLIAGMAFYSIKVGFVVVYRQGKGIRLRLSGGATDYAGSCEMVPKTADKLYGRFMFMVLGGSVFSLLFLAAAVICFFAASSLAAYLLVVMTAPVAVYMFFINTMPGNLSGASTDGGVFLGLLKKDSVSMATINILAVQSCYFMGKTPKEVDKALYFDVPALAEDSLIFIMLLNLRYIYYLDTGDLENLKEVSARMAELCDGLEDRLKHNIMSDVLYNICRFDQDKTKAEELHSEVKKYLMLENTSTNLRIRAAYAFYVEKNYLQARQLINRGLDESARGLIKGIELFETGLLNQLKNELVAAEEAEEKRMRQEQINATRIF